MGQIIIDGRNGNYPTTEGLPELSAIPDTAPPYPDMIMRCLGEAVNEGYPCVVSVTGAERTVNSQLFFADKNVSAMYFNGQLITSAYCGGTRVYSIKYVQK